MKTSRAALVLLAILVAENAWLLYPTLRGFVLSYQASPAARGRQIATGLGCFSCHGPEGRGGVPNPGSQWETVPGFGEQTLMMFVTGDDELREYVLDGAPERKHTDADYRAEMANQAIQMPGFRGYITEGELDEVIEYVRATSGMLPPPDGPIARGATLATQFGCFACHGELGIGGRPNPGALKGYIPGFFGHDFTDLVRSEDELLEWIREGGIDRIRRHPIGGYFFGRQRIAMPAYKRFASEEEIRDLAAYVRWLSEEHWRQIPLTH